MFPDAFAAYFAEHQNLLWLVALALDLLMTLILFRCFGRVGLYGAVVMGIVLANIQGPKLTEVLGMQTSLGVILYSGIFFATDLMSERYGRREANRAVRLGFAVSVIMVVTLSLGLLFTPSRQPETAAFAGEVHRAFETILNFTPRFVFGSLLAYLVSQSLDVYIFHWIKRRTRGRHLWLRNNLSTMTAQAVDTVVYALVVWWGVVDLVTALKLGAAKYVFKLVIAAIDTPFVYWARGWQAPDAMAWDRTPESHERTAP